MSKTDAARAAESARDAEGAQKDLRIEWTSHSPEETIERGRELAQRLTAPVLVLLYGELGSGKTTFTKGIVSGLGSGKEEDVTSPTFTLVHVFHNHCKVYHVDLYRIENFHDLETLALEDALSEPAIVIIEWSERFALRSDWPRVVVHLEHVEGAGKDDEARRISVSAE